MQQVFLFFGFTLAVVSEGLLLSIRACCTVIKLQAPSVKYLSACNWSGYFMSRHMSWFFFLRDLVIRCVVYLSEPFKQYRPVLA